MSTGSAAINEMTMTTTTESVSHSILKMAYAIKSLLIANASYTPGHAGSHVVMVPYATEHLKATNESLLPVGNFSQSHARLSAVFVLKWI